MNFIVVSATYLRWVYGEGFFEFLRAWRNYQWFFYHFFSMGILTKTLFAPWKRIQEKGGRGFDPGLFLQRLVINILLRLVGFFIRMIVILAGLLAELVLFIVAFVMFLLFVASPVAVPAMLILGVFFFFT